MAIVPTAPIFTEQPGLGQVKSEDTLLKTIVRVVIVQLPNDTL